MGNRVKCGALADPYAVPLDLPGRAHAPAIIRCDLPAGHADDLHEARWAGGGRYAWRERSPKDRMLEAMPHTGIRRPPEPHPLRMFGVGPQDAVYACVGMRLIGSELDISSSAEDGHDELLLVFAGEDGRVTRLRIAASGGPLSIGHEGTEREEPAGQPAFTVEKFGGVHSWTRVPLPWWHWRSLLRRLRP